MNDVTIIDGSPAPLSARDIQQHVNTIRQVMDQVMKPEVHYGVIPGCKTPSLFKPGAEKIMATFRLSVDPMVTDLSDGDQIRYQVKARLLSPSGAFVGCGIGECSSSEEKYKWRRAICDEEFEECPSERRREKWTKGFKGAKNYKQKQVRTEPADLANTVLKMAKKRALIDAVLTATAASDFFTQDVEDLPPEYIEQEGAPQPKQIEMLNQAQIKSIKDACAFADIDEAVMIKVCQSANWESTPAAKYEGIMARIKKKAEQQNNDAINEASE
jgi:hypothetical protein